MFMIFNQNEHHGKNKLETATGKSLVTRFFFEMKKQRRWKTLAVAAFAAASLLQTAFANGILGFTVENGQPVSDVSLQLSYQFQGGGNGWMRWLSWSDGGFYVSPPSNTINFELGSFQREGLTITHIPQKLSFQLSIDETKNLGDIEVIRAPWMVSGRADRSYRIEATSTINGNDYVVWTDTGNANAFELRLPNGNWTISFYNPWSYDPRIHQISVNVSEANISNLIIGEVPPLSPFQTWIQSFYNLPSQNASAESDPDNDGFHNELEFAFGSDPAASTTSVVDSFSTSGNFTMSWLQRDAGDFDYFVRGSGNLKEWGPAAVGVVDAPAGDGVPHGYIRKQFTVPATGRQFYRVLATDNPTAVPDKSFTIHVAGTPVTVERWGTGPKAIVFFGYIPFALEKNLKNNFSSQFDALVGSEYSIFLWTYPGNVSPYSEALSSLQSFYSNQTSALSNRVDLSGQASSVVQQIRASTGLTDICLVGNSFGAGVILWDFDTLASDTNLRFVLISPSELFMPFTPPTANPLPRTVLVTDALYDFFIVSNAAYEYFEDRDTGPFPPGYLSGINYPHFIIGGDEFATLEYVFDLIERVYQQQ